MNSTLFLRPGRLPTNANRIRYRAWSFRRTLIAAPGPRSGPLLSRRADRELPSIDSHRRWIRTLPLFAAAIGVSMLAIFNYQKSSSSVVNSTMYALRTSPKAREFLGDEIYFAQKIPWIGGEINQLHGRIDISFWVKGTRAKGKMRFKSTRENRMGFFRTEDWSLEMEDGTMVRLLNASDGDPFQHSIGTEADQQATSSI
ncbi:cytochrome oxidase assembly [Coccidioides immitis RS]|uniref:Cytochrome oxidase assembly n=3 Tax=Coccidioides immitis TaxID=5501 RepID=A0A0E1RX28_COCIM|nr:cytochrome oxidase assembly [Coccidioides immitis RS]EAS33204.2 cytochrome oxidase assembly [Coccidioides immitis RS]KMP08501.1 hypothetical protein CIRG_08182 [Coccidioides immitis RMSCC 2394]KMU87314.1 hypothetical protein CIHG_04759 [Coccidioides immitis H538.4]TPX20105.1 hypothetical protein DIZ76_017902 [Coccidioides immitis]